MNKIAVIGGGASGITAALEASRRGSVTIYERSERIGRKILASGNGRCNLTNIYADVSHYHGGNPKFILGALNKFWVEETKKYFEDMGLLIKVEDEGKAYPYSDRASSVLDVMRFELQKRNVEIKTGFDVKSIEKKKNGFFITSYGNETVRADKVIFSAGGKASPSLGSNGSGYEILKKLGHTVTDLRPSLVQIKTETDIVKKLKGIKIQGNVTMGKYSQRGEVLFTEYGLSGPPIFFLSAYLNGQKEISLDLFGEYDTEELIRIIRRSAKARADFTLEELLCGIINNRIGQAIMKQNNISPLSRKCVGLSDKEITMLARTMKDWRFKITGTMSWNNAQVTKGGISLKEVNPNTMESKIVKGLYITGEILDIDGDCGGYNLQWAWSSGYVAGSSV